MIFILLLLFNYSVRMISSSSGNFNTILGNSTIQVSLREYNVFSPEGESIDSLYTLSPHSVSELVLTEIPANVHFVVLQVHSYLFNITLSLDDVPLQNNSITGTNVGLVKMFQKTDLNFFLTSNSSFEEIDVLVSVQAYSAKAPIPGGCNMEFQVEISPFLVTAFDDVITDVNFAPSAPPLSVLLQSLITQSSGCNLKPSPVQHEMYYRYFPEGDFSKETYFNVLKSMMTKGRILESANLAQEKLTNPPMRRTFASYPGTGNAFVVVSHFENFTAVYVPSFTYGCNDFKDDSPCLALTTTFSKVLCAIAFFLGFLICFIGHVFFRLQIYIFGFLASSTIIYILTSIFFSSTIALPVAGSLGLVACALKQFAWSFFGLPIVSTVLATSLLGVLLASVIYYPIIDYVGLLVLDINYWGIFIGIVSACPILMLCLAEKANIISCAFLGSYIAILSIDHYVGSNLRYIFVNIIRRVLYNKFNLAITGPPFQWRDATLVFAWAVLMFLGIAVQKRLMRSKPPYPPPKTSQKNLEGSFRRLFFTNSQNERTPLLPHY